MSRVREMKKAKSKRKGEPPPAISRAGWWRLVLVIAAIAPTYASNLTAPFIFDDRPAIEDNVELRQWPDIGRVLASAPQESPFAGRPLVTLTFAWNYAAGGLDVRGYRLVNVGIHAACALLLFGIVSRRLPPNIALAITLIWAVHPLNSEVVSYLTQRTESAMAFFLLLTLYASVRARASAHSMRWQAVAVAASVLGMTCKETMVAAPVLVVLYDRIFVFGSFREAFAERSRFYGAVAASWIVLALLAAANPRSISAGFTSTRSTSWDYLLNQSVIITRYLQLAIWPQSLVLFYGWSTPTSLDVVWPYFLLVLALVGLTGVALRRWPALGFLGAWFFITLAPTSSFAPIRGEVGAERRMYLPLMALIVLAVVGGMWLWRRAGARWTPAVLPARGQAAGVVAVALAVIPLAAGTIARTREYASALLMAQTVHARWPSGASANMLGTELIAAGRGDEAMPYLREAARSYPPGRFVLGVQLIEAGALDEGIGELRTFIREEPNLVMAQRAELLIAQTFVRQQRWPEAVAALKDLLARAPGQLEALGMLADAYFVQGAHSAAITAYESFLALRPGHPEALANLAIAYVSTGRIDDAIAAFRQAAHAQPSNIQANLNLTRALLDRGQPVDIIEALQLAKDASTRMPASAPAFELLGWAFERSGDRDAARGAYARALAIDPAYSPACAGLMRVGRYVPRRPA